MTDANYYLIPMKSMKAQSATEYLMTDGWALLIIVIIGAVLYSMGVFNYSSYVQTTSAGFPGFQVSKGYWEFSSDGSLFLRVRNSHSSIINITGVEATYNNQVIANATYSGAMSPGDEYDMIVSGFSETHAGDSYSMMVRITLSDLGANIDGLQSSGSLTGIVV